MEGKFYVLFLLLIVLYVSKYHAILLKILLNNFSLKRETKKGSSNFLKHLYFDRTVCATLTHIADALNGEYRLAFANGGDQNNNTIPERPVCEQLGIELVDGLGDKIQSSSWLLNK